MTTTPPKGLDLDAIEATLEAMPRVPRFPAYFHDMRLLIEEVKRLRAALEESERWNKVLTKCYYKAAGIDDHLNKIMGEGVKEVEGAIE